MAESHVCVSIFTTVYLSYLLLCISSHVCASIFTTVYLPYLLLCICHIYYCVFAICTSAYLGAARTGARGVRHVDNRTYSLVREHILQQENTFSSQRTHSTVREHILYYQVRHELGQEAFDMLTRKHTLQSENTFYSKRTHSIVQNTYYTIR